jgi:predicted nucleotidyltransferase
MDELLKLREGIKIQKRYHEPLSEFVNVALEKYGEKIESIILFGSVAMGKAKRDSDIDILIVTKDEDFRLRRALIGIAFDILLQTEENIYVKVISKTDFDRNKNFSFLRNVILEGVKVV